MYDQEAEDLVERGCFDVVVRDDGGGSGCGGHREVWGSGDVVHVVSFVVMAVMRLLGLQW